MQTVCLEQKGTTKLIAHRGLSGIEPENTVAAFIAAGAKDYYGIETDVHKTSDGQFVVIHDNTTGRVAQKNYTVEKTRFQKLRKLPLTDKAGNARIDLHIPSLTEYIRVCKTYEKTAVLELKNEFSKEDIEKIIAVFREENYLAHVIFISFTFVNLLRVREVLPEQTVQYLVSAYKDETRALLKQHKMDIDIAYAALTKEIVDALHQSGIRVNCWTCDNKAQAEKLILWGVDFITTNILE